MTIDRLSGDIRCEGCDGTVGSWSKKHIDKYSYNCKECVNADPDKFRQGKLFK